MFALSDEKVPEEWIKELSPYCSNIQVHFLSKKKMAFRLAAGIFSEKPFQCLYHYEKSAAKKIKEVGTVFSPDKIFFQLLRTTAYASLFDPDNCVIDLMDCFSYNYLLRSKKSILFTGFFYQREYIRTKKYESQLLKRYSRIVIISQRDKFLLPENNESVLVVPNGVMLQEENKGSKNTDILFTGNLRYLPNIEAAKYLCKQIVPVLIKDSPGLKIMIAGANPHPAVLALQNQHIKVNKDIQDMNALKKSAKLFIAPMFLNTGIQNKILEAMACGIPALTTPQAADAIGAIPGYHLFIALSAQEFSKEAKTILEMPSGQLNQICSNARYLVMNDFNWEKNCFLMEPLFT